MKPITGIIMLALLAAVSVLGYLYYEESKDGVTVSVDPPSVTVD